MDRRKASSPWGTAKTTVWVQDYADHLGQWNSRLASGVFLEEPNQIAPAYINRAPVPGSAHIGTTARAKTRPTNSPISISFVSTSPRAQTTLTLPDNPRIKLLAATMANVSYDDIRAAQPLYDVADGAVSTIAAERTAFLDKAVARISSPNPGRGDSLHSRRRRTDAAISSV